MVIRYRSFTRIFLICLSAGLSILSYSFGVNCMNNALSQMLIIFQVDDAQKGLIQGLLSSSVYVGCLLGVCLGTKLLRFGNRPLFYAVDLSIILGSALLWIDNLPIFLIGRVIMGLGSGAAPGASSAYIRQYCPNEIYGLVGGLGPILQYLISIQRFSVGILLTFFMGLFFGTVDENTSVDQINNYWRYYFTAFPISICVIRIILLKVLLTHDSPLHYMKQNDHETARYVISTIYKDEFQAEAFDQIQQDSHLQLQSPSMFNPPYERRMYFAFGLIFITSFCGYNAVVQYSTLLFEEVFSSAIAKWLTFSISVLKLSVYIIGIGISQKSANFSSLTLLSTIYVPEILPAIGMNHAWILFWLCQCILLQLFPIMKQVLGLSSCFYFFGVITFFGQFLLHYYLIETKGVTEEAIHQFYYEPKSKVGINADSSIDDYLIANSQSKE